jgi:hypothetical protein
MKQRLSIVLVFVLLAAAVVTLEFQLRCAQTELQGSADVGEELCRAIEHMTAHPQLARQNFSKPETRAITDAPTPAR